jgi:hypothetical protein
MRVAVGDLQRGGDLVELLADVGRLAARYTGSSALSRRSATALRSRSIRSSSSWISSAISSTSSSSSTSSVTGAAAAGHRRRRWERVRVRAYVLPADPHRSELGSCRRSPPAHVRAGGPPQTDAIRAPSDRRRSGHARSISITSSTFLALHGHIKRRSGTDGGLRVAAAVSAAAGGGRSRCARRTAKRVDAAPGVASRATSRERGAPGLTMADGVR